MDAPRSSWVLEYVADPMCSWCYGFSPVLAQVRDEFEDRLRIALTVGGLSVHPTEPMDRTALNSIRGHWEDVESRTGLPFAYGFFDRASFLYDTEPSCRAVVAAGLFGQGKDFAMLDAIHRGFYQREMDVTRTDILTELAVEVGLDASAFENRFEDQATVAGTRECFKRNRLRRIRGFPTLLAQNGERVVPISVGYQPMTQVRQVLASWLAWNSDLD